MTANPALGYPSPMDAQPSARLSFAAARDAETLQNRVARGTNRYGTVENKNPHAVALAK